ncbi:hypothetical protein M422DRAFT_265669 [Sphaerobolus stellatus SS14]|uniref:Uncharacterized protein n=1 Tax=Sphaerobolus stellatus (strain SS14) TaxID=990650 RepID=A0A0C9UCS9_SPHS4|nr:hypothetical protein M422DRAFT_265669 [Sphaerobolus stellatus SS14]
MRVGLNQLPLRLASRPPSLGVSHHVYHLHRFARSFSSTPFRNLTPTSNPPSLSLLAAVVLGLPAALWAYKCLAMVVFQRRPLYQRDCTTVQEAKSTGRTYYQQRLHFCPYTSSTFYIIYLFQTRNRYWEHMQADGVVRPEAIMDVEHAANTVVHIAGLPNTVQVLGMNIMPTKMPFVGRG